MANICNACPIPIYAASSVTFLNFPFFAPRACFKGFFDFQCAVVILGFEGDCQICEKLEGRKNLQRYGGDKQLIVLVICLTNKRQEDHAMRDKEC